MKRIQTCLILIGLLCISNLYATDNEKAETIRRIKAGVYNTLSTELL